MAWHYEEMPIKPVLTDELATECENQADSAHRHVGLTSQHVQLSRDLHVFITRDHHVTLI